MESKIIMEKEAELRKRFGKTLLSLDTAAKYLGIDVYSLKELCNTKEIVITNEKYVKLINLAQFELGIGNFSTVAENGNLTLANSTLDNTLTSALSSLQDLAEDICKEDFEMIIKEYGEGSVYWNKSRKCFQMAFYLTVNDERKRKVVSGKSKEEVVQKAAATREIANDAVERFSSLPFRPNYPIFQKTVNEVADAWIQTKRSTKYATYTWYEYLLKHIRTGMGERIISNITSSDIQDFFEIIAYSNGKKLASQKLIDGVKLVFKGLIQYSIKHKYLFESPLDDIKIPRGKTTDRESKFLSKEKIARVLSVTKDNAKYSTLVYLLVGTGLRIGEALALEWNDIDFEKKIIYVRKALTKTNGINKYCIGTTKTQASIRTIPLEPIVEKYLMDWKKYIDSNISLCSKMIKNQTSNYLFVNDEGRLFNYQTLQNHFQLYLKRHGVNDFRCTFHMFRHSYGSFLIENGTDITIVSRLLGHSSIKITADIYCTITDKAKREAMQSVSQILKDVDNANGFAYKSLS